MSPAELEWIYKRHQAREIKGEMRWLLNAVAAAHTGSNGGDMTADRLEMLEDELKALCNEVADNGERREPKSKTPLSAEEFMDWLKR
jgi:hypothetical protein